MKRNLYSIFGLVTVFVFLASGSISTAQAGIDININFGPPRILVAAPSEMIMMPQTGIYFVTDRAFDIFFYNGYWWSPRGGHWYRSIQYNGSWAVINRNYVPEHLLKMPRNYREVYRNEKPINYGQWKKHYQNNGNNGQTNENRNDQKENNKEKNKKSKR